MQSQLCLAWQYVLPALHDSHMNIETQCLNRKTVYVASFGQNVKCKNRKHRCMLKASLKVADGNLPHLFGTEKS